MTETAKPRPLRRRKDDPADPNSVAVILPCYRSSEHVIGVIESIPDWVEHIVCVDDKCPDATGKLIEDRFGGDERVTVLYHEKNLGVGGAVLTGWTHAAALGADIMVKMDSDGQMDSSYLAHLIAPIERETAEYAKGTRFFSRNSFKGMPPFRIFANLTLTFASKVSSGYWGVLDPLNGYVAIRTDAFRGINPDRLRQRFMFESDLLCQLGVQGYRVSDVEIPAIYGDEKSNFKVSEHLFSFMYGYVSNTLYRLLVSYFIRDFNAGSLQLVFSLLFLVGALLTGIPPWITSLTTNQPATVGTVIIPALFSIFAMQNFLAFLNTDVARGVALQGERRRLYQKEET